jgi:hypothetical protein
MSGSKSPFLDEFHRWLEQIMEKMEAEEKMGRSLELRHGMRVQALPRGATTNGTDVAASSRRASRSIAAHFYSTVDDGRILMRPTPRATAAS